MKERAVCRRLSPKKKLLKTNNMVSEALLSKNKRNPSQIDGSSRIPSPPPPSAPVSPFFRDTMIGRIKQAEADGYHACRDDGTLTLSSLATVKVFEKVSESSRSEQCF